MNDNLVIKSKFSANKITVTIEREDGKDWLKVRPKDGYGENADVIDISLDSILTARAKLKIMLDHLAHKAMPRGLNIGMPDVWK